MYYPQYWTVDTVSTELDIYTINWEAYFMNLLQFSLQERSSKTALIHVNEKVVKQTYILLTYSLEPTKVSYQVLATSQLAHLYKKLKNAAVLLPGYGTATTLIIILVISKRLTSINKTLSAKRHDAETDWPRSDGTQKSRRK